MCLFGCPDLVSLTQTIINPNPLGIFTRKYPESTKIHQYGFWQIQDTMLTWKFV